MSFRLVVTDTFMITRLRLVVTGKVEGAAVETGQRVRMRTPDGTERIVIISSIEFRRTTLLRAEPGQSVGLVLRGVRSGDLRGTVLEGLDVIQPDPVPYPVPDPNPRSTLEGVELTSDATKLPLLLLPIRLETSFRGRELRIRAFPDQIHVDSFDPRLTEDEEAAGLIYLNALANGRSRSEVRDELDASLGPIRAQLVADLADSGGATALQMGSDGGLNQHAVARGLPRKLIAHGMSGGRGFTAQGREIPPEIRVAPGDGDHTVTGGGGALEWIVDFDKAAKIGLALTLDLDDAAARDGLDWLYVFGVDGSTDGKQVFAELMRAHAGTDGASTLAPLTPTKGSPQQAPVYDVKGARPDGIQRLTRALGLRDDLPLSRVALTDHTALVQSVATIVWEASLRPALLELYGAGSDTIARAREVYLNQIHPFGPYPLLQIGDQPYGIAPVTVPNEKVPRQDDDLLRQVGDAIRKALPSVVEAADSSRSQSGATRGYPWMVDTLLRHPIGQHWRLRTRTAAEAYLTPLARAAAASRQDAKTAAAALMSAVNQGRQLVNELKLPIDKDARLHASFGDFATPNICGPLVAPGAAADRTSDPLRDPGLEELTSKAGFWTERVRVSATSDTPDYESEAREAEPVLRLFAENAILQVLSDLAISEGLPNGRDADLVAMGVLDPGTAVIPLDALYLRARLAALVESRAGSGSLADVVSRFPTATPEGRKRMSELKYLVAAIQRVNDAAAGGTHAVFAALLDSLSTRADIWLMAEAEAALDRERRGGRNGVSIGAWGVLENVRPGELPPTRYASAPSQEFATTLGLLERARRGLATTGIDGAIRAELSGPRVAEAREILELLRQGRAIDAALSRRVAEKLNAAGRGRIMEILIDAMPAQGGAAVGFACDGLSFLERTDFGGISGLGAPDQSLLTEVQADLRSAMQTLGELHLVEGAAALSQRRVDAGQAVLAGLSAGTSPLTDLSVLEPSSAGTTLDFAVVACVGPDDVITGFMDLRTRLNPGLAVIGERLLGPMEGTVTVHGPRDNTLALKNLELSALSLAYLAAPGTDGVDRLKAYVRAHQGLSEEVKVKLDDEALSTVWAAGRLSAALAESRPLGLDDVSMEAEVSVEPNAAAAARQAAELALKQLLNRLPAPENATPAIAAELFAGGLIRTPDPALVEDARAAISARLKRAAGTDDAVSALAELNAEMPVMPSLLCKDLRPWKDGPLLQGAQPGELFVWLEESQSVRSRLAPVADLMLGAETRKLDIRGVQWPVTLRPSRNQQVDWIGAELREDDVYAARSSFLVVCGGEGVGQHGSFAGLLFDAWQEVVPDDTVTAGVVVDSPTPPARPPQLIVLAAPGESGAGWNAASVLEVLEATVAIARMRTVGLGSLPEQTSVNGLFGLLGNLLPVGAIRSTDTRLARAACPPIIEG
jgi:hypothetical protein